MKNMLKISLSGIVISTFLFLNGCCSAQNRVCLDNKLIPHLYAYDRDYVLNYLQKKGHDDIDTSTINKNGAGTSLYSQYRPGRHKDNQLLVASVDGRFKTLNIPARFVFLNEKEEIVAWFDDIQRGVNFKNGLTRTVPLFSRFGVDQSGKYFFIEVEPNVTEIAETDNPDIALLRLNMKGTKIFSKDGKIYLFDYSTLRDKENLKQSKILCRVVKKNNGIYEVESEIQIPYPSSLAGSFGIVDIDPWSENVLIKVTRDMPLSFLNSWYLFDLKSKNMTKIGHSYDHGFFLEDDILGVPEK